MTKKAAALLDLVKNAGGHSRAQILRVHISVAGTRRRDLNGGRMINFMGRHK